ncbi:MAG: SIS domain-containing protein [Acidimicrobiales bacterium]|jgi:glucosamine--fructose-6-phosphate aminotransferase (isomerizing)
MAKGQLMAGEMAEQPDVLARLVDRAAEVRSTGAGVVPDDLAACAIVARGSSDHAALLGQYLLEVATGRPVALASPSLQTLYRAPVDYRGVLVVGVSQSGATSEIVEVVAALRAAGARTIAITNDPDSPLAEAAGRVVDLGAGPELAVPATKTVTATLLAFVLLAEGLSGRSLVSTSALVDLPGHIADVLADEASVARAAARLTEAGQLVAVARGYLLAAARETALKLRETSGILAEGWSAADLRHGPVAAIDARVPVISVRAAGPAAADTERLESELAARGANVLRVNDRADADLPLPAGVPEPLANIGAVVRGQHLARLVSLGRGIDPDQPLGLNKVTQS